MVFDKFVNIFVPEKKCISLDKRIIEKYTNIVPQTLIDLWFEKGVGKYGDGIIELINPEDYRTTLENWLGKKVPNYTPLMLSAFGDLFYYRKLSEDSEDVCCIDPHARTINVCSWSLSSFFNRYLASVEIIDTKLRKELFNDSIKKLGTIEPGQIFIFAPALCMGGVEKVENISKGNALVQLDLLFQMRA